MKNIQITAIILSLFLIIVGHAGCTSSKTAAPGGLSGTVTDASGKPISGATVYTSDSRAYSDVYGRWAMDSVSAGLVSVHAKHERFVAVSKTVEVISGGVVKDINFILAANTELNSINVKPISSTQVRIMFNTKYAASGYVEYGTGAVLNMKTASDTTKVYSHSFILTDLKPGTTYRYRCIAHDEYGRRISSDMDVFTTDYTALPDTPSHLKVGKHRDTPTIFLTWDNNTKADFSGFNVYRSTSIQGPFVKLNTGMIPQGSFGDSGLTAGHKYYYRVTALSGSGVESAPSEVKSVLVPGYLQESVTWTAAESPYVLTGDLFIPSGKSLIIDKGVSVRVEGRNQWDSDGSQTPLTDICVDGSLMIQGTDDMPVSIISDSASPRSGDWEGIIFTETADLSASIIKGLNISHAVNGIKGLKGGPAVRNSGFYSCSGKGIVFSGGKADVSVRNCSFEDCSTAVDVSDNNFKVQVYNCLIDSCYNGVISKNNGVSEIVGNNIKRSFNVGIKVRNDSAASRVFKNTVGWGSSGTGIHCSGLDEIRRNTLHCSTGIEIAESCGGVFRSNLMLADKQRNFIGFCYVGSRPYNSATAVKRLIIEYNAVWNTTNPSKKYQNRCNDSALIGHSHDFNFNAFPTGPGLLGGDPFKSSFVGIDFDYRPAVGSCMFGAGYDYETIGASDVAE